MKGNQNMGGRMRYRVAQRRLQEPAPVDADAETRRAFSRFGSRVGVTKPTVQARKKARQRNKRSR